MIITAKLDIFMMSQAKSSYSEHTLSCPAFEISIGSTVDPISTKEKYHKNDGFAGEKSGVGQKIKDIF